MKRAKFFNDMAPARMFDMRRTGGNASLGHDAVAVCVLAPESQVAVGGFRRRGQWFHFAGYSEGERMSASGWENCID